jgi:hypothetical protein
VLVVVVEVATNVAAAAAAAASSSDRGIEAPRVRELTPDFDEEDEDMSYVYMCINDIVIKCHDKKEQSDRISNNRTNEGDYQIIVRQRGLLLSCNSEHAA